MVLAAGLLIVWLLVEPRTPDLAAQVYRLGAYERGGLAVWDERWYAGHAMPGYSLLFGPLGSLVGLRALAVMAVLVSVALFERIVLGVYGRGSSMPADRGSPRFAIAGACLLAVAAVGDVWSGRVTFALGVTFAMGSAWALWRARPDGPPEPRRMSQGDPGVLSRATPGSGPRRSGRAYLSMAALLAAGCAAASPVAGVLLALAGLTYALVYRRWWALIAFAGPVVLVAVPVRVLFAEGGFEPYPFTSFLASIAAVGLFWWALPRGPHARADRRVRVLRVGAGLYAVACGLCVIVHTPMGSNVERYGVLLAGPLLLCALAVPGAMLASGTSTGASGGTDARGGASGARAPLGIDWADVARVAVAVCAIALWVVWGPVRETSAVAGSPATTAAYYAPLRHWLLDHGAGTERVEVPLTRSHWEAAELAPSVSLARGWEKQLEERYDHVLLGHGLTARAYYAWLREQAVSYVALPDVPLDSSSAAEGRLIEAGLPYLRPVWSDRHWRVYAVAGATPIASGPGRLVSLGSDTFALDAVAAGTTLVRVHYSPYLTVTRGDGCVASAPGGWTYVRARAPGRLQVAARFSLGRALGLDGSCRIPVAASTLHARRGPRNE